MTQSSVTFFGGQIFDGAQIHSGWAAQFVDGFLACLGPDRNTPRSDQNIDLQGDILSPGYVDLQVNGGGGLLFNDDPSPETLSVIALAHRDLGATTLLPTLITDTPEKTTAAISATSAAMAQGVPGIAGLHLEGPHLSVSRKGAHDAQHIRPMTDSDLQQLLSAKARLGALKVTIAPENVTLNQVRSLAQAGILVSLGHSDADLETCTAYAKAGARCVTHLFNAMSQLQNRVPGMVGAALTNGGLSAGLIADGVHVHPMAMRLAWDAKAEPGQIFLVSDAMAVAGTDQTRFELGGRQITRENGCLTLSDGTLAGADLDLTRALHVMINAVGIPPVAALRAATTVPAKLIGQTAELCPGRTPLAKMIRIAKGFDHAALAQPTP
ncbi:MAG: N-acetylglucosamine-6-phosphate deacetylase [Pelagimonas sp.]|jgi:N-acetylglucosamine-6-phosphate deacetylase|nr:N-acetylglucosamine-6-phosphate deacetylase [Pelagimonas sp.]